MIQGFFADLIETRAYARRPRERTVPFFSPRHIETFRRRRARSWTGFETRRRHDPDEPGRSSYCRSGGANCAKTKWQAEEVYDREWAALLLRQAVDRLTKECALAGKADLFSHLMPYLSATEESAIPYEQMAERTHRPVTTLRSDVARLRKRYRTILREIVRDTVSETEDVDEELRYLCRVLAAR